MHYHIIRNVPGYLPETDPYTVRTRAEAVSALTDEKRHIRDSSPDPVRFSGQARDLRIDILDEDGLLDEVIEAVKCSCPEGEHELAANDTPVYEEA